MSPAIMAPEPTTMPREDKMNGNLKAPKPRFVRRISSNRATEEDLRDLRTVVVPEDKLNAADQSHDTATSFAFAREKLVGEIEGITKVDPEDAPSDIQVTDKYAFAFDIDGVLIRGGEPIPEAIEAMKMLNGQNSHGLHVPYIFVTNGGGKSEEERCIQLSKQLNIEVSVGQFICGHTPMREMAETYETVLVVGGVGEKCREVAEGYGFRNIITPGDIIKTQADTTPFRTLTDEELENSRIVDFAKNKIQAIFVFADSRDWAGDQQIILDVLTSKNGEIGTRSESYDEGPPLYFAHNDVVWATSHSSTRIGMGALRRSIEAMFQAVTGKELETVAFGKPQIGTFEFSTRLLKQWRKETHGIDAPPETVYFVGDTPESDIRGTNEFDEAAKNKWYSILVETGVYRPGTEPKYKPAATVKNVLEAVKHGMQREFKREQGFGTRTAQEIMPEEAME